MRAKRSTHRHHSKPTQQTVGHYAVCIVDVLAQSAKLIGWSELPVDGTLTPDFIQAMKQTLGTVIGLRKQFENLYQTLDAALVPKHLLKNRPRQQVQLYERARECRLTTANFSDTFVFYAPLRSTFGDVSPVPLFRMIWTCSMMMLFTLAAKVPVRGAITLGVGTVSKELGFYGPALADAHFLESKCAAYPRVVVSDEVRLFTSCGKGYSSHNVIDTLHESLSRECANLLCEDESGVCFIDFLQPMDEELAATPGMQELVKKAYDFVTAERDRFAMAGDLKLHGRYDELVRYMNTRLPLWHVNA